ncbi:LPXTG cell wall anchor domain-containing protein [Kitasatospora sp. NPDC051853]|uniref:LPXTG cell wall anchor domain-containing protein n=1 Tax=Kitasatospora sp. NPDC051853 TaxID=3364058 RepID=UPI0037B61E09
MTTTVRTRTTVAAATVLLAVAAPLTLSTAASAEPAGTAGAVALSVAAPEAVGFAGQPVEFSETVTNPGATERKLTLSFSADVTLGAPNDALVIDYKDQASGTWKAVPLAFARGIYSGTLPTAVTVPAGGKKTLDLRIGAPMGLPHQGATNGGIPSIPLHSVLTAEDSTTPLADELRTIALKTPKLGLGTVPSTAVIGGAPVEFDAVLVNDTPSGYVNLANALTVAPKAVVEVRRADGSWQRVTQLKHWDGNSSAAYLDGRDSSLKAGADATHRVRVSYPAGSTPGDTRIDRCLVVNEHPQQPLLGTTHCVKGATVKLVTATTPSATPAPPASGHPSATASPSASVSASASASTSTDGRLAETGAGRTTTFAAIGAALIALGAGVFLTLRRRSS